MTRWLPIVAVGLLVALAAVLLVRPSAPPTDADRAEALAAGLRCPDCQGLSVADSHTPSAVEIRRQIDELIGGGASDGEVRAHFVDRYGEWVLLAPRQPVLWIVPFAVFAAGLIGLAAWLRERPPGEAAPAPPTDEERRRLHDEAEALDA